MTRKAAQALLDWYDHNRRHLPWRRRRDPYAILVAEVMLQQTRVDTVVPYYERWMRAFPTLKELAAAEEQAVLREWEGLGYYRRAHNLLALARCVLTEHNGRLPATAAELQRLPGVGRYTAAAVGAIAYDQPALALDGNLRRVLARWLDYAGDVRSSDGERALREGGEILLAAGRPGDVNQALMDLSSAVCLPRQPRCAACPMSGGCRSRRRGVQHERPRRSPSKPTPMHVAAAGVIWRDDKVLLGRRPQGKLLGGMWEFPGGKAEAGESIDQTLRRELREELGVEIVLGEPVGHFSHAYTHFRIEVYAFECHLAKGEPELLEHTQLAWRRPSSLGRLPMGKIDRSIARVLQAKSRRGQRSGGRQS
jgi:A/G-specific adenine glycosylase